MNHTRATLFAAVLILGTCAVASAATNSDVQTRINADIADGKPIVIHVVVALCDNATQGIVPVSKALGNGQDPKSNLYWGALYGVSTYLPRSADWTKVDVQGSDDSRVLERIAMYAEVERDQDVVPVYIVADAWDGAKIRDATLTFLKMSAGRFTETVTVKRKAESVDVRAGGGSHVVVYVGHNGLMDFSLETPAPASEETAPRSAIILACASKSYFIDHLGVVGAHPLLLTTDLMAPEAYTLDSALRSWIAKGTTEAALEGAADAYNRYQKCGLGPARRLFWGQP